jgi:hypothetical protein
MTPTWFEALPKTALIMHQVLQRVLQSEDCWPHCLLQRYAHLYCSRWSYKHWHVAHASRQAMLQALHPRAQHRPDMSLTMTWTGTGTSTGVGTCLTVCRWAQHTHPNTHATAEMQMDRIGIKAQAGAT